MARRRPHADEQASVEKLLDEARACVARMPATPGTRELRARLDQYRRAVEAWAVSAPTDDQRSALREQILAILKIANDSAPTLKVRKLPE